MDTPHKVSFCITCKGRLEHLRQTLPVNLRNNPDAEFVVLDYGSEDGLENWMKENCRAEIDSKKIRYAKVEPKDAPNFRFAHAKNMAHRLATGDIVCNLDADNIAGPGFAGWLVEQFSKPKDPGIPGIYVRPQRRTQLAKGLTDQTGKLAMRAVKSTGLLSRAESPYADMPISPFMTGAAGRIAILKEDFVRLRGYAEHFDRWGGEDGNLDSRAHKAGLICFNVPYTLMGAVLEHSDAERTKHLTEDQQTPVNERLASRHTLLGAWNRVSNKWRRMPEEPRVANPDGQCGCGKVALNFGEEEITIPSLARVAATEPGGPSR